MRDALDPDHWVNGGDCESFHPDAMAMQSLNDENKKLRAALERIRDHDKIILSDHMDAVRAIAREALE